MKFTAVALAATLAATPLAHYATAGDPVEGADAQIVLPAEDEAPWYEQAEDLRNEQEIVMVSREITQPLPEPEAVPYEEDFGDFEVDATEAEIDCLMSAVYFEARGEPREGKIAVVEVVLARRESGRWPSTACAVISQRAQFSFVRRGHIPDVPAASESNLRSLVLDVLSGRESSSAKGATFFHATYSRPSWRHRLRHVSQIGRHMFYSIT